MWLKACVGSPRSEAEGGGRKLLSYWSQRGRLLHWDGLVFRLWEREHTGQEIYQQLCLPEIRAPQVLCALHNDPSAGHRGVTKTLEKVRRRFYWHGLREGVENHIRRCRPSAEVNNPPKLGKSPMINVKSGHPLQRVAIDMPVLHRDLALAMSGYW